MYNILSKCNLKQEITTNEICKIITYSYNINQKNKVETIIANLMSETIKK
jgi:hypothetical protein